MRVSVNVCVSLCVYEPERVSVPMRVYLSMLYDCECVSEVCEHV